MAHPKCEHRNNYTEKRVTSSKIDRHNERSKIENNNRLIFSQREAFSRRPLSFENIDVSWDNDEATSGEESLVAMRGRVLERKGEIGGNRVFRECCSSKGIR